MVVCIRKFAFGGASRSKCSRWSQSYPTDLLAALISPCALSRLIARACAAYTFWAHIIAGIFRSIKARRHEMKAIAAAFATLSMLTSPIAMAEEASTRENTRAVAPALEKYSDDLVMGEVWKRPGLSPRDRSIVTVAAMITRNQTVSMRSYVVLALDNGVKPAELSEIITHLAFYAGWANASAAVAVVKDVFAPRKIGADQLPAAAPKLLPLNETAEATRKQRVGEMFDAVFPGVTQYTTDVHAKGAAPVEFEEMLYFMAVNDGYPTVEALVTADDSAKPPQAVRKLPMAGGG
jgi:alkylhydroperoxidase/carboxymuconolactone decarboxylase family protein YurZ